MAWRLRWMVRQGASGIAGQQIAFGLRFGYWPCLKAPFITLSFWRWHFEFWCGLPSMVDR